MAKRLRRLLLHPRIHSSIFPKVRGGDDDERSFYLDRFLETSSKSQRTPDTRMSGANTNRMMGNAAAAGGGFNPMMPNFNPAAFGNMNMNPYGGFNPMAAAAAARGGFMGNFENMMNMAGVARGGRGGGGGMAAMRNQQFMHRMGRGGPMMGGGGGASGPAGNGGTLI